MDIGEAAHETRHDADDDAEGQDGEARLGGGQPAADDEVEGQEEQRAGKRAVKEDGDDIGAAEDARGEQRQGHDRVRGAALHHDEEDEKHDAGDDGADGDDPPRPAAARPINP